MVEVHSEVEASDSSSINDDSMVSARCTSLDSQSLDDDQFKDCTLTVSREYPFRIVQVSESWLRMFHWKSYELVVGRGCSVMYGPQTDLLKMHEIICGTSDKKKPGTQFASLYRSDSSQFSAHIKAKQATEGEQKFAILYMMRCDTMHMYQAVAHEETPKAVITVARPGRLVFVNDLFVSTFGFSKKQAERSSVRMIQGPRSNPATWQNMFKKVQTGFEHKDWLMVYSSDCSEILCRVRAYPVVDGIGRASCVMILFETCSEVAPPLMEHDVVMHYKTVEMISSAASSTSEDSNKGECSTLSSCKSPVAMSDLDAECERQKVRAKYNRSIGIQLQEEMRNRPRSRKLLCENGDCHARQSLYDNMTSFKKKKFKSWIQRRRSLQFHVGYKSGMDSTRGISCRQDAGMDDGLCIFGLLLDFFRMIYRLIAKFLGIPIKESDDDDVPRYNECQTKRVFESWIHLG